MSEHTEQTENNLQPLTEHLKATYRADDKADTAALLAKNKSTK